MEEILRKAFEYGMEYIAVPVAGIPFDIWYTQHKDKIDLAIEKYLKEQNKKIVDSKDKTEITPETFGLDKTILVVSNHPIGSTYIGNSNKTQ